MCRGSDVGAGSGDGAADPGEGIVMPVAHRVQLIQHDRRASELPQHRHDLRLQRVVEARVDAGHVAAGEGIPGDGGDLGVFLSWGGCPYRVKSQSFMTCRMYDCPRSLG